MTSPEDVVIIPSQESRKQYLTEQLRNVTGLARSLTLSLSPHNPTPLYSTCHLMTLAQSFCQPPLLHAGPLTEPVNLTW